MELFSPPEQNREVPISSGGKASIPEPTSERSIHSIAELITRPEFPKCAIGEQVDIGGYVGVVVEIVNQSIKVRSPEGAIRGFNIHALRKLYGPAQPFEAPSDPESQTESVTQPANEPADPPAMLLKESAATPPAAVTATAAPPPRVIITEPNFSAPIKPISDLVTHPDFPRSALGENVDIGGSTGVIVEIVRNSIKVRLSEGGMMSYNVPALHKLYGPHTPPEAVNVEPNPAAEAPVPPEPAVKRDIITDPNFDLPLKSIEEFLDRSDFPKCAFGEFIDLRGYTGIVVEIVNRSLKVRSREGSTRSYNADGLRKAYRR